MLFFKAEEYKININNNFVPMYYQRYETLRNESQNMYMTYTIKRK